MHVLRARLSEGRVQAIFHVLIEVAKMMFPSLPEFFPLTSPLMKRKVAVAKRLRARQLECLMPLLAARREFIDNGMRSPVISFY